MERDMSSPHLGSHAVVIGAGMGGLAAAAAISEYFGQVTVLDRDALRSRPGDRAGTPQARHLHVLLAGGLRALCELLAGFEDDLVKAGAVPLRAGLDIRTERPGFDPFPKRDLSMRLYAMSRPLLEFTVRERIRTIPNVAIQAQARVTEIVPSQDLSAVTGVRYSDEHGKEHLLPADLVIDSSGRGVPTLELLAANGRQPPKETRVGVNIGYTTARYRIPTSQTRDWKAVLHLPSAPGTSRGSLLYPLEGNEWILALGGRGDEKPPGDEAGLLQWARQLRMPTIYDAIAGAERVGEVLRYGFPESIRREFSAPESESFPIGLLPFADAICIFNPVYGQGMSVAAQEAILLKHLLADPLRSSSGLALAFFKGIEPILEAPWAMSVLPDFVFAETTGERPADLMQTFKFGAAITRLAARDADVHKLMAEVGNLVKPRSAYREPEMLKRVLAEMSAA